MKNQINQQIAANTYPVCVTQFSHVRLMNDKRWPWFILLPNENPDISSIQRPSAELHQLSEATRAGFMSDVNKMSELLQEHTQCKSVNIAMLGNVVSDLHCHVIARDKGDTNWPKPVWGFEKAIAYDDNDLEQPPLQALLQAVRRAFKQD